MAAIYRRQNENHFLEYRLLHFEYNISEFFFPKGPIGSIEHQTNKEYR